MRGQKMKQGTNHILGISKAMQGQWLLMVQEDPILIRTSRSCNFLISVFCTVRSEGKTQLAYGKLLS